jgi:hypothetical protein
MGGKEGLGVLLTVVAFLLGSGSIQTAVAQDDEGSKAIKAEEFITNRPAKSAARKIAELRYKPTAKSPNAGSKTGPPTGMVFAQLGVTIWRFRPATSADRTKELVEEEGSSKPAEYALERIEDGTPLSPGQIVRLSIESLSRDGYLYVIDREQYSDGSMGDARLLFPIKTTRNGDNHVKAGRLIYIPAPPKRFRIKPSQSSKGHVAELLTILVSSKPLIDPAQLSTKPLTIDRAQMETWEKQWATEPTKFEMEAGAGQTMTDKEQAAALDASQELTQDDPVPQTVYRVAIKPDSPLLISVPLRFGPLK